MDPPRISPPEFFPRAHTRTPSLSPARSLPRHRITEDILSDLSPTTTLEAFTSPSGKLRASIEAATPSERAFGIRATIASKKIQEWVDELSAWPWPAGNGSAGFEIPAAKRRRISADQPTTRNEHGDASKQENGEKSYIGSLPAEDVSRYEIRIDEINEDMEDLNVEEIKSTVLNTHFSPKSRPSSSGSNAAPMPSLFASYTRMDDFTAIVTATVLQSLPNLSRLMRLIDVWTIRLLVLRKVPPLLVALEDSEVALQSGWQVVDVVGRNNDGVSGQGTHDEALERKTFAIMKDVLQEKVTTLGQNLDYMLDTLEGREDTLPEIWLDRMEEIEKDYGEWVVCGDRKVREGEWAELARARKAADDRMRKEEEVREAARLQAEKEKRDRDEKLQLEADEATRIKAERVELQRQERLRLEEEAEAERVEMQRQERLRLEEEAEAERVEMQRQERLRLEQEAAAESARLTEVARRDEDERVKAAEVASRLKAEREDAEKQERLRSVEAARQAELSGKREADRIRTEKENARQQADLRRKEEEERLRLEAEAIAQAAHRAQLAARNLDEERFMAAEIARQQAERQRIEHDREQRVKMETEAAVELPIRHASPDGTREMDTLKALDQAAAVEARRFEADVELGSEVKEEPSAAEHRRQQANQQHEAAEDDIPLPHAASDPLDLSPTLSPSVGVISLGTGTPTVPPLGPRDEDVSPMEEIHPSEGTSRRVEEPANKPQTHTAKWSTTPDYAKKGTASPHLTPPKPKTTPTLTKTIIHSPSSPSSRLALFDGSRESKNEDVTPILVPQTPATRKPQPDPRILPLLISTHHQEPGTVFHKRPSTPRTPPPPPGYTASVALASPSNQSADGQFLEDGGSPRSPSKLGRFGHGLGKMLRRNSSPAASTELSSNSPGSPTTSQSFGTALPAVMAPMTSPTVSTSASGPSKLDQGGITSSVEQVTLSSPDGSSEHPSDEQWIVVDAAADRDGHGPRYADEKAESSDSGHLSDDATSYSRSHNRSVSLISGYSTSDPTPEIHEAEPAEYFSPTLSPIKSVPSYDRASSPMSASRPPMIVDSGLSQSPNVHDPSSKVPAELSMEGPVETVLHPLTPELYSIDESEIEVGSVTGDGAQESVPRMSEEFELEDLPLPVLARRTSIAHINSGIRRIEISRRESSGSDTSTIITRQPGDSTVSPVMPSSPLSEMGTVEAFPDVEEESPSKGRGAAPWKNISEGSNPPSSPPPMPSISHRPSVQYLSSPSLRTFESESQDVPKTPKEAPLFDNIDLAQASLLSSPKKSTDDQIQAQISSLLESIPARIRLTSEPETTPFTPTDVLRPAKPRRSITPSLRSHSSLSMRAPTPSFTLAPAYGKGISRPRPQNGNPEIKLYHLSRSTGEAPIKLFVRLVGENGERVMVRVGGGWADLGEYLREYASHHGRRSATDSDKVEVQDMNLRVVSTSSTASSSATLRGNGRSSPISRPGSAFDRPMSSLHIRKTRKSFGETDSSAMTFRSPSTPQPMVNSNLGREFETPPSEKGRSSSRLSWGTEDEGGLGLAGPKSKKVAISERDQEWVDSMKEKVRLASAEKEREKARKSFGEMDKIGGTKRLFRKG